MKAETISYKANLKEEKDDEGNVTAEALSYDGTVVYNMPETIEEAVQMFGDAPALSAMLDMVKIKVQAICRRHRTQEEAQEAVSGYVPGVTTRGTGPTQKQVKEVLSKMSKEDLEKLMKELG
jgi:hypothetical protein